MIGSSREELSALYEEALSASNETRPHLLDPQRRELLKEVLKQFVSTQMDKLTESEKALVIGRYWGSMSILELSKLFFMKEAEVDAELSQAMTKLKAYIDKGLVSHIQAAMWPKPTLRAA